jgi:hypothetical protein
MFHPIKKAIVGALAVLTLAVTGTVTAGSAVAESSVKAATPISNLPRIPWEGGPAYWKKIPAADKAGWDSASFFPITAWYSGISSNAEVQWDKAHGINTYIGMWEGTDYALFRDNGVFWIGDKLNSTFNASSTNWVGNGVEDEPDGKYSNEEGHRILAAQRAANAGTGRMDYTNFTQIVISKDGDQSSAERYVNNYSDVVSADMYWYTIPFCDWDPYRGETYIRPVYEANCRTASSYGKTMDMMRARDGIDGKRQPIWQFVENLNGGPGPSEPYKYITPAQLKGAAMSSVINEARGLVWFNQSFSGPCWTNGALRTAQVTENWCGDANITAMGAVNKQVQALAPVLNTQSYYYSFGLGLDTMLKVKDGYAYVFAMVDGRSRPGARTFTLPGGVTGKTIEVVNESRTLTVSGGKFTDRFASENSYHIYKIKL